MSLDGGKTAPTLAGTTWLEPSGMVIALATASAMIISLEVRPDGMSDLVEVRPDDQARKAVSPPVTEEAPAKLEAIGGTNWPMRAIWAGLA